MTGPDARKPEKSGSAVRKLWLMLAALLALLIPRSCSSAALLVDSGLTTRHVVAEGENSVAAYEAQGGVRRLWAGPSRAGRGCG